MISRAQRQPESAKARDRTGEVYGPYVAVRPVGANPLKSEYWVIKCGLGCGYEQTRDHNGMAASKKQKHCGGCRGNGRVEG